MIKFDVLNRLSGEVQFTAEIEAEESAPSSVKLGLAVKWAVKNGADLYGADLREADLRFADLRGANLSRADLRRADLRRADLREANLQEANLQEADLHWADLQGADMQWVNLKEANLKEANLRDADLQEADLRRADLREVNLRGADLRGANLSRADLRFADLRGAIGNLKNIKSMQIEDYCIVYTDTKLSIGCETHSISDWKNFNDAEIEKMDRGKALKFLKKWKPVLMNIIEMSPAEPTGAKETK